MFGFNCKSIREHIKEQTEVIVVLNRCTDQTEEIAKSYDCITLKK